MILVEGTFKIWLAKYLHKPLNEYKKSHQYSHLFSQRTKTTNFKRTYICWKLVLVMYIKYIRIQFTTWPTNYTNPILFSWDQTHAAYNKWPGSNFISHTKISKTNVLYRLEIAVMGYFVLVQAYILVCKSNSKQTHKLLSGHRADPSWMKPSFIFTEKICQFAFSRQR